MKMEYASKWIAFKDKMQAQAAKKYEGLSDEQTVARRREWLATSDNPVAEWWRQHSKQSADLSSELRK